MPEASLQDVEAAKAAAAAAQPAWAALSPQERGIPLKRMAELVRAEKDELARLDAISMGRPVNTFFDSHYAATQFDYFAEAAYGQGHTSLNTPGFLNISLRQPYGVVGIIIPWNTPLVFFSKKVAPAVAAETQSCSKQRESSTHGMESQHLDRKVRLLARCDQRAVWSWTHRWECSGGAYESAVFVLHGEHEDWTGYSDRFREIESEEGDL